MSSHPGLSPAVTPSKSAPDVTELDSFEVEEDVENNIYFGHKRSFSSDDPQKALDEELAGNSILQKLMGEKNLVELRRGTDNLSPVIVDQESFEPVSTPFFVESTASFTFEPKPIELPSIYEATEEEPIPSAEMHIPQEPDLPPPAETVPFFHSRAVSAGGVLLSTAHEDVDSVKQRPNRANPEKRCVSQAAWSIPDDAPVAPILDRSLSTSDSDIAQHAVRSDQQEFPLTTSPQNPPPVTIQRKISSKKPSSSASSWMPHFPIGSTGHGVVVSASLPSRHAVVATVSDDQDRSTLNGQTFTKRQTFTKSGSDTFSSISNRLFGRGPGKKTKVNSERSLATLFDNHDLPKDSDDTRKSSDSGGRSSQFYGDLPTHMSTVFTACDSTDHMNDVDFLSTRFLESDAWNRFDLFGEVEYHSWHEKYRSSNLSTKAVKKQDAIFELILKERQHCANIVFLKRGYRDRLLHERILEARDVDRLIPDVLDSLLMFHLNLLSRLDERQRQNEEVETISDIIAEEFSEQGAHTTVAIDGYTTIGVDKEASDAFFKSLMEKNSRFLEWMKNLNGNCLYSHFNFKEILSMVLGRTAKYGLLLESIMKNEANQFSKECEMTQKANEETRKFAMRIDNNINVAQILRQWDRVRAAFDSNSSTTLCLKEQHTTYELMFTMDDLKQELRMNDHGSRKLICLGDVRMKLASRNNGATTQTILLVLFDDLLLCLLRKGTKFMFIPQQQSVFAVCSLLLRVPERGSSVMVMATVGKPLLLDIEFKTKSEKTKWIRLLEAAISNAPRSVRLSKKHSQNVGRVCNTEEEKARILEEQWLQQLDELFEKRNLSEESLLEYMRNRLQFVGDLRDHIGKYPQKSRVDLHESQKTRADVHERVVDAVRGRLKQLRSSRNVALNKMLDDYMRVRDSELWSFFDERHDFACSDSDEDVSRVPRRIHTFHGVDSHSSKVVRRHTTVPHVLPQDEARIEEGLIQDEMNANALPLNGQLQANGRYRRLVEDIVVLKVENNKLRNENAITNLRLEVLKRNAGGIHPTLPVDQMELLRRKEQDLREQRRVQDERERTIEDRERVLEQERAELVKQKEALLEAEAKMTEYRPSNDRPPAYDGFPSQTTIQHPVPISPQLKTLATNSTKKTKK